MVSIASLWLPILVAAALVWIASALVWMVLPHHRSEFRGLPDEEAVRHALGRPGPEPGQYTIPHAATREEWSSSELQAKLEEGPAAYLTVVPRGKPSMAKRLALTFLFYLVVGVLVAYLAGRTLPPGADYLAVFRVTGTVAWAAYGFAVVQDAIWFGRPWSAVGKQLLDALLYALLTAGAFGWLWPA